MSGLDLYQISRKHEEVQRGILTELRSLSQTKCPDGHVIPSLQEWQSRQMIHSESSLVVDDSEIPFIRILKTDLYEQSTD
jgi:hypothetical protein